ncbi:MAG: hypothetical protein AB1696_18690 [Planctomycetota bacterium]
MYRQKKVDRIFHALNAILLACALVGCVAPGAESLSPEEAAGQMEQVRTLLTRFEEGVRNDDMDLIMSLYSPSLSAEERDKERARIAQAVRSQRYSEYRLSHAVKDMHVPADALREGFFSAAIEFSKPGEKVGDDVFTFRREGGQWYLVHVEVERPGKGEYADLRPDERERIVDMVAECNQAILSGDMDALVDFLPKHITPSERGKRVDDLNDLFKFHKYQYFSSSFSRTGLEIAFGEKGTIAVPLEYMFVRHDGTRGERKVKLCFQRAEGEWRLVDISERGSGFWKTFGRVAVPVLIHGAKHAGSLMR